MAGSISEEDIQKVREATDIVAVIGARTPVKQRGRDFWCCCPLHNEKTPSFKIDPALQLWHCFGCGEGGDVFGFLMKTEDLSFPDAVRKLAEQAHIEITETGRKAGPSSGYKARLKEVCKVTAEFYHTQLMRSPQQDAASARAYLAGRNMGGEVPKSWNLGFAPGRGALVRHLASLGYKPREMIDANVALERDGKLRDRFYNRVMFPIFDVQGDCIAFGGRVIGKGEPKYLNSQETPLFHKSQVLYGLDKAKGAMAATGVAIVVEGYTDVIALHEAGVKNVVATLGTALTRQHIRVLSRHAQHRIVYLFDGDAAGQRAADRALGFIDDSMTPEAGKSQVELAAVTLPDNLDPAEFVAAHGADALRAHIDAAQPLLKYGIERRLAAFDLSRAEGRAAALASALSVLAPIKNSLLAKDYAIQIASRVRMREQDVLDELAKLPDSAPRSEEAGENRSRPPLQRTEERFLSQAEANRRTFEREFLGLLAKNPSIAMAHVDTLAQTQWHDGLCARVAECMLGVLAQSGASISAADVITRIAETYPQAAGMLTGTAMTPEANPEELGNFLADELGIGDAEDAVAALRAQLSDPANFSPEEYDMVFESVVGMQKDLVRRRETHRPIIETQQ